MKSFKNQLNSQLWQLGNKYTIFTDMPNHIVSTNYPRVKLAKYYNKERIYYPIFYIKLNNISRLKIILLNNIAKGIE